jgi:hypothetical protein
MTLQHMARQTFAPGLHLAAVNDDTTLAATLCRELGHGSVVRNADGKKVAIANTGQYSAITPNEETEARSGRRGCASPGR